MQGLPDKTLGIMTCNSAHFFALGERHYKQGLYEDAVESLVEAIAVEPKDAATFYLLGRAYVNLGRQEQAFNAFRRSAELDTRYAVELEAVNGFWRF